MNKTASDAVYVVVAVVLIFASSAQATPLQSASALVACTVAQLSLTFKNQDSDFDRLSQSGALLLLLNIDSQACNDSSPQALVCEDASNTELPISHKCSSPASARITLEPDVLLAPFTGHPYVPNGQDAKYRFAYLQRDPVYVRSKS